MLEVHARLPVSADDEREALVEPPVAAVHAVQEVLRNLDGVVRRDVIEDERERCAVDLVEKSVVSS